MSDLTRSITIDKAVLKALCHTDQIRATADADSYLMQEKQSLYRLRHRLLDTSQPLSPEHAFLVLYDCLFRHVSIALLAQGYQFTSQQPHQTLRRIVRQNAPDKQVQQMIAHRHMLKKTISSSMCAKSITTLTKLLNDYDIRDAQACQMLCLLPLQRIVPSFATR